MSKLNLKSSTTKLLGALSQRNASMVALRHGIGEGNKKTLEAIGKQYNITRERVRQIEEASYDKLRGSAEFELMKPFLVAVEQFLNEHAGVATEEQLMDNLVAPNQRSYLSLVLALSNFSRIGETNEFKTIWAISTDRAQVVQELLKNTSEQLHALGEPVQKEELLNIIEENNLSQLPIHEENMPAVLSMSKTIKEGPFGKWGLAKWPHINPRGVRDKAHLVMQRHGKPLHFRKLAQKIDEHFNSGNGSTHPQTAHNELIKDDRFVLIGRGTYALADWGYVPGTVKDVIIKILQDEGKPLEKKDLVNRVLGQRQVQENTVLLNLQSRDLFKKEGNKYYLA